MEFRTLRAFVEVVRQGGFARAAKTVFATQSTVSKAVRQLEAEIGFPLLDRALHPPRLTAAGEVVYARATRLLAERDDLAAELEELRGLKRGTLRLGLPPVGSGTLFAPLFALYRTRYPGVAIRLVEHGAAKLEELLLSGEIDLAASLLPAPEVFSWQEVRREPLVALLPAGHELAGRKAIGMDALRAQPFILFEEGFALNKVILESCRRHGFEPMVVAQSSQIDFITELAAAGLGIALLPRLIAEQRAHPQLRAVLLEEPGAEWNLAMIWRKGGYLSHAASAWLALLREAGAGGMVIPKST